MARTPRNRVREFRERKGWSQEELAYRSGTTGRTISRIENGHQPGSLIRRSIAEALGRPQSLLFPGAVEKVSV